MPSTITSAIAVATVCRHPHSAMASAGSIGHSSRAGNSSNVGAAQNGGGADDGDAVQPTNGCPTSNGVAMDVESPSHEHTNGSGVGEGSGGGASSSSGARTATGLDRVELVRVIAQAVRNLGYSHSAAELERESGVEAMSRDMRRLRDCVLRGQWEELESILARVDVFANDAAARSARFVLYEQKFLELLEAGEVADALSCLRNQLTLCAPNDKALHRLPMLHMCNSPVELRRRAQWPGAGRESRMAVLEKLRAYIPHAHLLQENRLETLLSQSIELQKTRSKFPYTKQSGVCLLEDLEHEPKRLPRTALHKLSGHSDEVWFVRFSHNGKLLASASKDKSVIIWDAARVYSGAIVGAEAVRHRLQGHTNEICFLSWSPDDSRLLSCGADNSILLWNVVTGEHIRTFKKHGKPVVACMWMPHGRTFFSGSADKKLYEWDAASGETVAQYPTTREIMDTALSKDGKRLVCCLADNDIVVYDTESRTSVNRIVESMYITSCSLADDGRSLLVNITSNSHDQKKNVSDSEMHIWDIVSGNLVKKFTGFQQCRFVIRGCFGGYNQMFVLCGSEDKLVHVWERQSGDLLMRLDGHSSTVNSVHWSPTDPQLFASGSDDNAVIVSTCFSIALVCAIVNGLVQRRLAMISNGMCRVVYALLMRSRGGQLWGVESELRGPAHQVPELSRSL